MDIHVQVKDDEYQEFKDKHLRELWSATGAYCNVPDCDKTQFFRNFNLYKKYFGLVHQIFLKLYACRICNMSRKSLSAIKKHLVKDHKCEKPKFRVLDVPSKDCIDPKDTIPYRVGSADERKVAQQIHKKVEERKNKELEEAKERHRRQAETNNTPYVEDKHNARDEKLTFDFSEKSSKLSRTVIRKKSID
jgi:alpha-galactosidase/6-phospho-beta-glucosidase family protein